MFFVCIRTTYNGKLHLCAEYASLDLARWWAIAFLRAGYFPTMNPEGLEMYVPTTSVASVIITDELPT